MTNPLDKSTIEPMPKVNSESLECPECHADWRGSEIPRDSLAEGYYGHIEPCQKKQPWHDGYDEKASCTCPTRYFSRLIGIEFPYDHPDHYDGVSQWQCPDCGTTWNRWIGEIVKAT